MRFSPSDVERRIEQPVEAWQRQCPDQPFGETTLAQYMKDLQPYHDAKAKFAAADAAWDAARVERNAVYVKALEITKNLVSSVKGHPKYGENSALYHAMGYVPESERKSGLTRRREVETKKEAAIEGS